LFKLQLAKVGAFFKDTNDDGHSLPGDEKDPDCRGTGRTPGLPGDGRTPGLPGD